MKFCALQSFPRGAKFRKRKDKTAYFTKKVKQNLAKPPLNFNDGLAKLGLTS